MDSYQLSETAYYHCMRWYRPSYTFDFFQPKEIISEFDLNKRKVFIRIKHFILDFCREEVRFEDIERIEIEDQTV